MTTETPPATAGGEPTPPAGGPPPGDEQDGKIKAAIDAAVEKHLAGLKGKGEASPPATGAGTGGPAAGGTPVATPPLAASSQEPSSMADLESRIAGLVAKAFQERDREDALIVLQNEVDRLKAAAVGTPRKPGWGRFLIGPGIGFGGLR